MSKHHCKLNHNRRGLELRTDMLVGVGVMKHMIFCSEANPFTASAERSQKLYQRVKYNDSGMKMKSIGCLKNL